MIEQVQTLGSCQGDFEKLGYSKKWLLSKNATRTGFFILEMLIFKNVMLKFFGVGFMVENFHNSKGAKNTNFWRTTRK